MKLPCVRAKIMRDSNADAADAAATAETRLLIGNRRLARARAQLLLGSARSSAAK